MDNVFSNIPLVNIMENFALKFLLNINLGEAMRYMRRPRQIRMDWTVNNLPGPPEHASPVN